jgi:hypothetical protein
VFAATGLHDDGADTRWTVHLHGPRADPAFSAVFGQVIA